MINNDENNEEKKEENNKMTDRPKINANTDIDSSKSNLTDDSEKIRLNKYLASIGIGSRREIDKMCDEGRILINGTVAKNGMKVSAEDEIVVDNKQISTNQKAVDKVYYLLNKPLETLSATKDFRGRVTVTDLIDSKEKIFPIGRLDYNTTGLLILTNDGELFNKLVHPKSQVYKEYIATINGRLTDEEKKSLEEGIVLDDGLTLPAKVNVISSFIGGSIVSIQIREGRKRQVRRMFLHFGHRVVSLRREKIGALGLGDLEVGKYRSLTDKEVKYLYSL